MSRRRRDGRARHDQGRGTASDLQTVTQLDVPCRAARCLLGRRQVVGRIVGVTPGVAAVEGRPVVSIKRQAAAEALGQTGTSNEVASERHKIRVRSEENTSELQSLLHTSYAVF